MTEYVWTKPAPGGNGLPNEGVPQIIIAERIFSSRGRRIVASETKILGYAIGTWIPMWVENGAPINNEPQHK